MQNLLKAFLSLLIPPYPDLYFQNLTTENTEKYFNIKEEILSENTENLSMDSVVLFFLFIFYETFDITS
jgi:hypothetical protein